MSLPTGREQQFDYPAIANFEIVGEIGKGANSIVYRARRKDKDYAVKVLKGSKGLPEIDNVLRFRQEAAAIARLNHPNLVKIFEVGEQHGEPYLAMEYLGGQTLQDELSRGPLPEDRILWIAREIVSALIEVHRKGLIHRDLKPANIIVTSDKKLKIIDFGFAVPLEENNLRDANKIVGTFLYSSPEQIGALKRTPDVRSDFYALGALLYQCATGNPPFQAVSLSDLFRKHMTETPANAHKLNPEIRPIFGAIIEKLLSKDPDDRYQTAEGLLHDLEHLMDLEADQVLAQKRSQGKQILFKLGGHDNLMRVTSEIPLIGRARELSKVRGIWTEVRAGKGAMLQIEGEAGSGKTRLIRELMQITRAEDALVMMGKAQQSERIPFGPLREAVDDYISRTLRLPLEEQEAIRLKLLSAGGEFVSIVKRLSKRLEKFLGETPEIPPLDPANEQDRFYEKTAEFLLNLARSLGPVLLLVDDVQWLDEGSLEVLKRVSYRVGETPLLVASTSRNDVLSEAARSHYLKMVVEGLVEPLVLEPLDVEAVEEFISAYLGGNRLERPFVEKLATRSNGNPFALGEYLRSLLDQGLLRPTSGRWLVDTSQFSDLALPTDVIQLLINRIVTLSEETSRVISTAAVIGYDFDVELLISACNTVRERANRALEDGIRANLIERSEGGYSFVHDRIREAIVKRLPPNQLRDIHQTIAECIERIAEKTPLHYYALARHFREGHAPRNRQRVYDACFKAGVNALENFSNEESHDLLSQALEAARQLEIRDSELLELRENLGTACVRTGRHKQAHQQFQTALASAVTQEERIRMHIHIGQTYANEGENEKGWEELQKALGMLGKAFPKNPLLQAASILWNWMAATFIQRTGLFFGSAKGEDKKRRETISTILTTGNFLGIFIGQPILIMLNIIRQLHNVQYLGTCVQTAKAQVFYSILLGLLKLPKRVDYHGQRAITMAKQIGDPEAIAYCHYYYGVAVEMAGDVLRGNEILRKTNPEVQKYCTAWDKSGLPAALGLSLMFQGRARQVLELWQNYLDVIEKAGCLNFSAEVYGGLYSTCTILGRFADAEKYRQAQRKVVAMMPNRYLNVGMRSSTIEALLDQEDLGTELDKNIQEFFDYNFDEYHNRYTYINICHARHEQLLRCKKPEERKEAFKKLKAAIKISGFPRAVTPLHTCHLLALKAALAREEKKFSKAKKLLDRAEQQARQVDSPWGRFAVAREKARLALKSGDLKGVNMEAQTAYDIANQEGWKNRSNAIKREFRIYLTELSTPKASESPLSIPSPEISLAESAKRLLSAGRYVDALLQVSLATSKVLDPDQQMQIVLDQIVKILGAERAYLFLVDAATGKLAMKAGRDVAGNDLPELHGYSSTVVTKVFDTRKPLVVSGTEEGEALGSESAVVHNLRSIIAVPICLQDNFMGVVYLDNRLAKGVFTEDDIGILTALGNHIAINIETAHAAQLEMERRALAKDLELTGAVQSLLLPKHDFFQSDGMAGIAFYRAASHSGGDWWWHELLPNGKIVLMVGDVTGHGVASAMMTALVSGTLRALRSGPSPIKDTPTTLHTLSKALLDLSDGKYLMTMIALEIWPNEKEFHLWSAGCPPLMMINAAGEVSMHGKASTPLGTDEEHFEETKAPFEKGSRLFIFTDGLYEFKTREGRQFGKRNLQKLFIETRKTPLTEVRNEICSRIDVTRGENPFDDDVTLLILESK